MRICSVCNITKNIDCFHKRKASPSGYRVACKSCRNLEYNMCKGKRLEYDRKWYILNKDRKKQYVSNWISNNKERVTEKHSQYISKRLKDDVNFKLAHNLRNRLQAALKGNYKAGSAVSDLGCSVEDFRQHIESLWKPGMNWDNWTTDGWHIDHKEAISKFNLSDLEELKKACHYTNLQPLWAKDNLSKGNK